MNTFSNIMDKVGRFLGWLNLLFFLFTFIFFPKMVDTQVIGMGIIGLAMLTVFAPKKEGCSCKH